MCICVWVCVVFLFKLDLPSWELLCSSVWNNINSIFLCGVIRTTIYRHLLLMFMLGNCSVVLQHYCQVNYGAESGPKRVKLNQKVTFEMETLGCCIFSIFSIQKCISFLQFCILYFQFFLVFFFSFKSFLHFTFQHSVLWDWSGVRMCVCVGGGIVRNGEWQHVMKAEPTPSLCCLQGTLGHVKVKLNENYHIAEAGCLKRLKNRVAGSRRPHPMMKATQHTVMVSVPPHQPTSV